MKVIGDIGENQACRFLKKHGYKIVQRNYSTRFGEIDIIAQINNTVVFVEVKKRKNDAFGGGSAAVTHSKQSRIIKAAQSYAARLEDKFECRFDVIEINGDIITHIENAFY